MALVSRCLPNVHIAIIELGAAIKPFPIGRFPTETGPCDCQDWTTQTETAILEEEDWFSVCVHTNFSTMRP